MTDVRAITGFCGAELLPHAIAADGSPAPAVCTKAPHDPQAWHGNDETGEQWAPELSRREEHS